MNTTNETANARIRLMVRKDDEQRAPCPECGCRGPHGDNGCRGDDRRLRCVCCGTKWNPAATEMAQAA